MLAHGRFEGFDIVPRDHDDIGRRDVRERRPSWERSGWILVERIGALEEPLLGQAVEMPVEFQVLAAPGGGARNPQGDDGRFGADAGKAHPLGGGNDLDHAGGELFVEGRFGGADDAELDPVHAPLA